MKELWVVCCAIGVVLPLCAQAACAPGSENALLPESTPASAFEDHGDGTVTHLATGLMWKRCSEGQAWDGVTCQGAATAYTWGAALGAADAHVFAGKDDWRLPNIKELVTIVEQRCWNPAINVEVFPAADGAQLVWSATPGAGANNWRRAWAAALGDGSVTNPYTHHAGPIVRLVRSAN